MSDSKYVWVLFDSVTQIQSQPLFKEQMQTAIFKMHKSDLARFHVWTTGWESWQPLNKFLDSDQTVFVKDLETAKKIAEEKTVRKSKKSKIENTITKSLTVIKLNGELTKTAFNSKDPETRFDVDNLTWSKAVPPADLNFSKIKSSDYSNRSSRHILKIEILLISSKGKTFRSYSKNISLTGSMLEDNVPFDYYGNTFDAVIVSRYAENPMNSRVQLKCKTVGDGITSRIQFENLTEDQKNRLTTMLNEYIEKQKAQLKKTA